MDILKAWERQNICKNCKQGLLLRRGLKKKMKEDFYNLGLIKKIEDIYNLDIRKKELVELEGFGEKSISNLLESIKLSKENSLERLIFALGISGIGEKNAKILAKRYQNIDNLINATSNKILFWAEYFILPANSEKILI